MNSTAQISIYPDNTQRIVNTTLKYLTTLTIASVVTLALFWAMSLVIAPSGKAPEEPGQYIPIDVVFNETKMETEIIDRLPPPKEAMEPPKTPDKNIEPTDQMDGLNLTDTFTVSAPQVETTANTSLNMVDGEARPIVRVSPQYPIQPARDGIEGWVQLSFTINETGGVEDVEVLEAEPKRVFNRAATRALKKWKYQPKVVDGNPVKQFNITVQLDFNLQGNDAQ